MDRYNKYILKCKMLISISFILLTTSITLSYFSLPKEELTLNYKTLDIRNVEPTYLSNKASNISKFLFKETNNTEPKTTVLQSNVVPQKINNRIWYSPVYNGRISQYPSYYHVAYDITGYWKEPIYPIADGVISNIYRDMAGALIVMVRHEVNGAIYTSQYVHLASYANIYVGQYVSHDTVIGYMGSSGRSSGVHLHLALLDCDYGKDNKCPNLNDFFKYDKRRYKEGFSVKNILNLPNSWNGYR